MKDIKLFFDLGQSFDARNVKPLMGITGLYFIYNNEMGVQYPFKKSKLIYIGMSERKTNSIGARLKGHLDGTSGNQGLLSYAQVNNVSFTYINFEMLKSIWNLSIESLECFFISDFVKTHGVYPICNNKSGYELLLTDLDLNLTIDWKFFHDGK